MDDKSFAEMHVEPLINICNMYEEEDNDDMYEEIRASLATEACLGFRVRPYVEVEGEPYFAALEFSFIDRSSLMVAENEEGELAIFVSNQNPQHARMH